MILVGGSGGIAAAHVSESLVVRNDGLGSLIARDIGENLVVGEDGSGSISNTGVGGIVDIPSD